MFCRQLGANGANNARPCRGSNSPIWLFKITLFRQSCNWTFFPHFCLLPSFLATTISCLATASFISGGINQMPNPGYSAIDCIDSIETPINTTVTYSIPNVFQVIIWVPSGKLPQNDGTITRKFIEKSTRNRLGHFQWDLQSSPWSTLNPGRKTPGPEQRRFVAVLSGWTSECWAKRRRSLPMLTGKSTGFPRENQEENIGKLTFQRPWKNMFKYSNSVDFPGNPSILNDSFSNYCSRKLVFFTYISHFWYKQPWATLRFLDPKKITCHC